MTKSRRHGPASLALSAWAAGAEAQQVIALRLAKLALGGPAASLEANRMVEEKVRAAVNTQSAAVVAVLQGNARTVPGRTLATYRRVMRANRRRLLKEFA